MGKIALLSEQLINQIAAGEVVERPGSVMKELLENSIDAGARKIVVTVRQGGIGLLKIADDGCGMSSEDALLSLERHATSKIRSLEDLQAVKTMGFRGEALASIASVSRLTMRTRRAEDDHGIQLFLEGGRLLQQSPIGCQVGTEIEVANLFYNTLPRLKFLKSEQTEYQNILDTVIQAALVNPQIAFKLIQEDDRIALDLPPTNDSLVRIRGVLGQNIAEDLLEVFYGGVTLSIRGYIGKPQLSRANRSLQYFFVNGRPISSHVLSYAVKQAYHSLLPKERHPVFVIFFELEPSMVDVNCHPRKTEVKFRDEREVYRVVLQSCSKALEKAVLIPKVTQESLNYYQEKKVEGLENGQDTIAFHALRQAETVNVGLDSSPLQTPRQQETAPDNHAVYGFDFPETAGVRETAAQTAAGQTAGVAESFELKALGQLDNSFILCQRGHDLVIIDQHAAHERIRYNKLMSEADCEEKTIQPLLMPINIDLAPADIAVLDANKEVLEHVGIGLEHFGGSTFAINEVPSFLVKTDLEKVLAGLIDDLKTLREHSGTGGELSEHKGDLFTRKEKALTYLACRSAVKFGDPLGQAEIVALIEQLNKIPSGQFTCPHGRPIMIVMERSELWSRFGRKYTGFFEQEKFRDVNC